MKYAHLEENTNKILGWYSEDIHSEIPTPNIEVTDEVWQEALNINANCYENGEFIVKDFRTDEQKEQIHNINLEIAQLRKNAFQEKYFETIRKNENLLFEHLNKKLDNVLKYKTELSKFLSQEQLEKWLNFNSLIASSAQIHNINPPWEDIIWKKIGNHRDY